MKLVMVIDKTTCIGCHGCTMACKQGNGTPTDVFWTWVETEENGKFPNATLSYMPHICMHCDNPPCVPVCPTGATRKLNDNTVIVDEKICQGCGECANACPYGARYVTNAKNMSYWKDGQTAYEKARYNGEKFNGPTGKTTKCDFCRERWQRGEQPACVATCLTQSRIFGDLDDPKSEVSLLLKTRKTMRYLAEEGTEPTVYYITE